MRQAMCHYELLARTVSWVKPYVGTIKSSRRYDNVINIVYFTMTILVLGLALCCHGDDSMMATRTDPDGMGKITFM